MENTKGTKGFRNFLEQLLGQLLGGGVLLLPGLLLFWLTPVWLVPILFPVLGIVWAMVWTNGLKLMKGATGMHIITYVVCSVLILIGVVPDMHDLLGIWERKVKNISYEAQALDQAPLSMLYFENWEVQQNQITTYQRRRRAVQGDKSMSNTYVYTSVVPLRKKRKPLEEIYVIAVDGNIPMGENAITYWKQEGLVYGFVPNKMRHLTDYKKAVEKIQERGIAVHPRAIFVELFDSAEGKKEQLIEGLKIKLGAGVTIWFFIHLATFIFQIVKTRQNRP